MIVAHWFCFNLSVQFGPGQSAEVPSVSITTPDYTGVEHLLCCVFSEQANKDF